MPPSPRESVDVFLLYCLLLVVSGITMLVSAVGGFGQRPGARIAEGLFGSGFFGYGVYLLFFFTGGEYRMFFYAFVAPILTIFHVVKARSSRRYQPPRPYQPPHYGGFGGGTPADRIPPPYDPFAPPPGTLPPGTLPPGSFPPGSFPAGTVPPGSFPPGSRPPGSPPAPPQVSRTGPSTSL